MTRLRPKNLKDEVEGHLRKLILGGSLRAGQKIDQDRLASELGVSKLPVREALIGMEKEGLTRIVPRRGAYVASLTPDDVRDHYHIYGVVSGLAAQKAAARLSSADLSRLNAIQSEMDRLAKTDSPDVFQLEDLNEEFHRIINRAGGSKRLSAVIRMLAASIPSGFFGFATGWTDLAHEHHAEIIKGLEAGDGEAAAFAVEKHLRQGGELAVTLLQERGFWDTPMRAMQSEEAP